MSLNVFERFRVRALAVALGATVAGCGGGGGGSTEQAGVTEVTTPVSSTNPSAGSSDTTSTIADAPVSTTGSAATTINDSVASASPAPVGTSTPADNGASVDTVAPQADAPATQVASSDQTATPQSVATRDTTTPLNTAVAPPSTPARSGVGMNLNQVSYFSPETPTIDLMKKASPWLTQCNGSVANCAALASPARAWDTLEEAKLDLDANGWVKSLPAANSTTAVYRTVSALIFSGNFQQLGKYVVTYDGSGTLTYNGAMSKSASESTAGRDVVNVVNNGGAAWLTITATNPSNYIRNIRVLPPGGVCGTDMTVYAASAAACTGKGAYTTFDKLPSTVVWHPQFLQDLKGSRTLRFMDWGQTNTNLITSWSKRTQPTAHIWSDAAGVPVEAMFDLARNVGADPWINLPAHVDDDYIHQFAKLAHAKMATQSVLYLEYGNEMWNYAFPATKWAYTQAQTVFAKQVAASGGNPYLAETNWYMQRLVNACQIVKGEFGADASRVKCVANTQASVAYNTSSALACTYAATTLGKPCGKFIDAVAIAPYFAYYINSSKTLATVASWYTDADGGVGRLFQEILGTDSKGVSVVAPLAIVGSGAPTSGALAQIKSWAVATKAVADTYGLPMMAYEGGQGMTASGDAKLQALLVAANRDPRMATAYQQMMSDWRAIGGQTFNFFTDVKTNGTSGLWGLKENQFDTTAPKWQAATQWRNTACWWSGC